MIILIMYPLQSAWGRFGDEALEKAVAKWKDGEQKGTLGNLTEMCAIFTY